MLDLTAGSVHSRAGRPVWAADETHMHWLPHVRASWMLHGTGPRSQRRGKNRPVTVFGVLEMTTGRWVYRLGHRRAAYFLLLLDAVLAAFPAAWAIVVICDNDSIHHVKTVIASLAEHPRLELLYGVRYSPHDNRSNTSGPG